MVLVLVGAVVAVASAARSTWSPCGLSMLSTITPFGETARRHRYSVTAGWFVLGSLVGGATLGGAAAALAELVRLSGLPFAAAAALAAALAAAGSLLDAGAFGPVLPVIRRQVDDRWLARYRQWVYGTGFGWQIGVGFATYLMTAGVVLVPVLGALSGSPFGALALGLVFGLARGATVFLTARCADPGALRNLHSRLDRIGPAVRWGAAGVQAGTAAGLALASAGVIGTGPARAGVAAGLALAVAVLAAAVPTLARLRRVPAPRAGLS